MSNINKLYNIWIKNENNIGATYGNVSLYSQAKGEINQFSTARLGVGCDSSANAYTADINGATWVRGNLDISGNINNVWLDASLNLRALDNAVVKLSGDQSISGLKEYLNDSSFNGLIKCGTIVSPWLDASLNLRALDNAVVKLSGNNTISGNLFSSEGIKITNTTIKELRVEDGTTALNSVMTYSAIRTTGYFWAQGVGTANVWRGTKTGNTNYFLNNDEISYISGVTSSIQTQLDAKAGTADTVTISGTQTITGAKTFSSAVTCSSTLVGMTAMRMSGGSIQTSGGLYYPSSDFNRKIVLSPVASNEYQNYSIGTRATTNTFQFMVPDLNAGYYFSYGTSTTTKSDMLKITTIGVTSYEDIFLNNGTSNTVEVLATSGSTGGIRVNNCPFIIRDSTSQPAFSVDPTINQIDISGGLTMYMRNVPIVVNDASNVRVGGWSASKLDLSSCDLQLDNMYIAKASNSTISGATTIPRPFNQYYAVEANGVAYNITLGVITLADLGKEIVFRKVRQTGAAVSISFVGNGVQKLYANNSVTGATTAQAWMTSTTYVVRIVPLLDPNSGAGLYAWFQL